MLVFLQLSYMGLVGVYDNLRRQAIAFLFLKRSPKFFAREIRIPSILTISHPSIT
jgi:hypothetical protein